jgi:hypothetical protein
MVKYQEWRVSCKKRQKMKRIMTAPKIVGEIRLIMKPPPEEKMLEGVLGRGGGKGRRDGTGGGRGRGGGGKGGRRK